MGLLHLGLWSRHRAVPTGSAVDELTHTRPSPRLLHPCPQARPQALFSPSKDALPLQSVHLASQPTSYPPLLKPDCSRSLCLLQKSKPRWLRAEQRIPAQPPLNCISSQNVQSKVAFCHLSAAFRGFP